MAKRPYRSGFRELSDESGDPMFQGWHGWMIALIAIVVIIVAATKSC